MSELVIVRNKENLKGIFYYSDVDYQFFAETNLGNISQLAHYEESSTYWETVPGNSKILIKFSSPILVTNYSIIKSYGHTYPASFILYGKQNGRFIEIDKQENQKYNGDDIQANNNLSVTYRTKSSILTKEILLKQTLSSKAPSSTHLLLRGLEFYGIVCKNCRMISKITCKFKNEFIRSRRIDPGIIF